MRKSGPILLTHAQSCRPILDPLNPKQARMSVMEEEEAERRGEEVRRGAALDAELEARVREASLSLSMDT